MFNKLLLILSITSFLGKGYSQSICDSVSISPETFYINQFSDTTVTIDIIFTGQSDISYSACSFIFQDTTHIQINDYAITNGVEGPFIYTAWYQLIYNNPNIPSNTVVNAQFHIHHGGIPVPTIDCYLPVTFIINSTNSVTGLNEPQNNLSLILFPNPAKNMVSISVSTQKSLLSIFDLLGRKIYSTTLSNRQSLLDMSFLPNGIYIATIQKNDLIVTQKIIKADNF